MASDGMKEGTRRLAKAIEVVAWLWLVLFLSLGAISAWGQQSSPVIGADGKVSNSGHDHEEPMSAPGETKRSPASSGRDAVADPLRTLIETGSSTSHQTGPSISPQIDPSKVQWDQPGKAAPPSAARHAPKSQMPGLPPDVSDAPAASGDDPFSRFMAQTSEQKKAAPPPPPRNYFAALFLALVGVVGFAILRTLAWILAGFAK